jgi:molybdopterin-containing oxidoreductase family iron-sulfur binding subunit
MDRRTFLKAAGLGSVTFAYGCNRTQDKNLFSLVVAPEDMVTGKAAWYASTCAECPAGCGVLAKNREGRVIKLEGNPLHPINKGNLCIRGQSAIQDIYNPDRLISPKLKEAGTFKDISFDEAIELLSTKIEEASAKGPDRIKMMTGVVGDQLAMLFETSLKEWKSEAPIQYEPFSYDSLRAAHRALFGNTVLPAYKMDEADIILGFGADFLETWLSPVEYAGKFKAMHSSGDHRKGLFVHVGPFMSLTAANADSFLSVRPGDEVVVALGVIRALLENVNTTHLPPGFINTLTSLSIPYSPPSVEKKTGVKASDLNALVKKLQEAKKPLVIGGSSATASSFTLELSAALINVLLDKDLSLYDFNQRHSVEKVASGPALTDFLTRAGNGADLLLLYRTNPLYCLPGNEQLKKTFSNKRVFKVSFSATLDESSLQADLVIPVRLPLETWDAHAGKTGLVSTSQPTMGKLTKAPQIGDIFIELTESLQSFENFQHFLMDTFFTAKEKNAVKSWVKMIQTGGVFKESSADNPAGVKVNYAAADELAKALEPLNSEKPPLTFLAVPSIKYFDGRGANKPWLNEIPDPVTNVAWESMAMVHPETLKQYGLRQGDMLEIRAGTSIVQAPA